jgi:thiamine pyrophosphokinase
MNKAKVSIKQYPAAKDQTDMELALDLALDNGAAIMRILGGLGGRIDHTLSNIGLLLIALNHGVEAHLLDEKHDLAVANKKICLPKRDGWAVSLVPLTETVHGVTTSGLKYPLNSENLFFDKTRGIHNEFLAAENAIIEVTDGNLLIVCFRE